MKSCVSNSVLQTSSSNSMCNCRAAQSDSHSTECFCVRNADGIVHIERTGYDWPNIVIAVVAVGGLLSRWIYGIFVRPRVKFKKAERYNYKMPSSIPDGDSQREDSDRTIEFYVPITNVGRGMASNVSVSVDCILESGGDGDSYDVKYFGMPMQMEWRNKETSITIAAHDDAYFRFASLSSGMPSVNTPGADTEEYVSCSLCAKCISSNRLLLSKSKPITVLARISVRAENTRSAKTEWISLHWNGGNSLSEVSNSNFKIRLAERNEADKANDVYEGCIAKGVQS